MDQHDRHRRQMNRLSESTLTLGWLTIGAGLGWGSDGAIAIVFGMMFVMVFIWLEILRQQGPR
jgi:hypothetical protein